MEWKHIGNDIDDLVDPSNPDRIKGRVTRYTEVRWIWRAYDRLGREAKGESPSRAVAMRSVENVVA